MRNTSTSTVQSKGRKMSTSIIAWHNAFVWCSSDLGAFDPFSISWKKIEKMYKRGYSVPEAIESVILELVMGFKVEER